MGSASEPSFLLTRTSGGSGWARCSDAHHPCGRAERSPVSWLQPDSAFLLAFVQRFLCVPLSAFHMNKSLPTNSVNSCLVFIVCLCVPYNSWQKPALLFWGSKYKFYDVFAEKKTPWKYYFLSCRAISVKIVRKSKLWKTYTPVTKTTQMYMIKTSSWQIR